MTLLGLRSISVFEMRLEIMEDLHDGLLFLVSDHCVHRPAFDAKQILLKVEESIYLQV